MGLQAGRPDTGRLWLPKQVERALAAWLHSGRSVAGVRLWGDKDSVFMPSSYEEAYFQELATDALKQVGAPRVAALPCVTSSLVLQLATRGWHCGMGLLRVRVWHRGNPSQRQDVCAAWSDA